MKKKELVKGKVIKIEFIIHYDNEMKREYSIAGGLKGDKELCKPAYDELVSIIKKEKSKASPLTF